MRRTALTLAGGIFISTLACSAQAQVGSLLGLQFNGEAYGKYRSKNVIRATALARPDLHVDLLGNALRKLAEMSKDKGFPRFGVTKSQCSTTLVNHSPTLSQCRIVAQMVAADEEARPNRKEPVTYYLVDQVLAGR